jgi:purine nucleosidase
VTQPILIDTDPGQDDAVALLLALASPELEVVGVTTVAGNVPLTHTSRNALKVCELAGRTDLGVYAGSDRPMRRPLVTAEYVHGPSGLDGADLPDPTTSLRPEHAVDFMVETIHRTNDLTICTLGPLTNLATAIERDPTIVDRIGRVVMMGGSFSEGGNRTPAAEFNIYVDPHAADIVFSSGLPLVLLPLDVTHQVLILPAFLEQLRNVGTRVADVVAGWLEFFERYDLERYGARGGPLHDPCVVAYLLRPGLFDGKDCHVAIETRSELTMGMTVVDWWGATGLPANCRVVRSVDAPGFFTLLLDRLSRL